MVNKCIQVRHIGSKSIFAYEQEHETAPFDECV